MWPLFWLFYQNDSEIKSWDISKKNFMQDAMKILLKEKENNKSRAFQEKNVFPQMFLLWNDSVFLF